MLAADSSDALFTLCASALRSILVLAVIALAVCGLVAARGVSRTSSSEISAQLTRQEMEEVSVQPASSQDVLTAAHLKSVGELPGVRGIADRWEIGRGDVAPGIFAPGARDRDLEKVSLVLAVGGSYFELVDGETTPAHAPSLLDDPDVGAYAVIVGSGLADQLAGDRSSAQQLWVSGRPLAIAGVAHFDDTILDRAVFLSAQAIDWLDAPASQSLLVRTEPGAAYPVSQAIPLALDAASPDRFTVSQPPDLRNLRRGVKTNLDGSLLAISLVLVVMAVISISAVLMSAAISRTREIGLRRAVGMSRARIARQFLIQGAILGVAGGAVGASLGSVAVIGLSLLQSWSPILDPSDSLAAITIGGVVGLVSSGYPAWRAAGIEPALAARTRT